MSKPLAFKCTRLRGVTLTELLVVIAIMIILMAILVPALGAFTHTSRVISAADNAAAFIRQARHHAMTKNVPTIPFFLRDKGGRITMVYAYKVMTYKPDGVPSMTKTAAAPITWLPSAKGVRTTPFAMTRQSMDLPQLQKGAFCFWVGASTLNITDAITAPAAFAAIDQPYYELMYMKVTPNLDPMFVNDSSKYTYQVLMRGVHNTAKGAFTLAATNKGQVDIYMVAGGENAGDREVVAGTSGEYTLTGVGVQLPNHIEVDQIFLRNATREDVVCTITGQAAVFREDSLVISWGGKYEKPEYYPIFLPIFMPDGRVSSGLARGTGAEVGRSELSKYVGQTLRVFDSKTRETRYIHVKSGGQTVVRTGLPGKMGEPENFVASSGGLSVAGPGDPIYPPGTVRRINPVTPYVNIYPPPPAPPPPPPLPPPPPPPLPPPPPPPLPPPGGGGGGGGPPVPPPVPPPVAPPTPPPTPPPPPPPPPLPPPLPPPSTSSSGGGTGSSGGSSSGGDTEM